MNQFAIDKAGVTMVLLSPLTDREYLAGKAVGNALIAGPPALASTLAALVIFPGGSPASWLALPIALTSVYLLVAPLAAILSAIFPRVVDLNSIGRGSNAHGLAGLLGMLAFFAAGVPCVLIAMAASRWLQRPALVPVLLLGWCAVTVGANLLLFSVARTDLRHAAREPRDAVVGRGRSHRDNGVTEAVSCRLSRRASAEAESPITSTRVIESVIHSVTAPNGRRRPPSSASLPLPLLAASLR